MTKPQMVRNRDRWVASGFPPDLAGVSPAGILALSWQGVGEMSQSSSSKYATSTPKNLLSCKRLVPSGCADPVSHS